MFSSPRHFVSRTGHGKPCPYKFMASLILNPILTRELRARWRGGRSMILVISYAAFLAVAAGIVYATSSISNDASDISGQMARVGHNLFLTLSGLQIVAWMLIAPALTATTVAAERERGLLETLQLTPLSPWRICGGKLLASLLLVVLLMFAPLPITSLCFLLGGVSPGEFGVALAMQTATILCGMCLGLWISCRSRRATGAMTSTFVFVGAWSLLCFFLLLGHESRSPWIYAGATSTAAEMWHSGWLDFAWRTNPLLVFLMEIAGSSGRDAAASWANIYLGVAWPDWVLNCAAQLLTSLIFLVLSVRTLAKPFADAAEESASQPARGFLARRKNAALSVAKVPENSAIEYSIAAKRSVLHRKIVSNAQDGGVWWQWNWLARFRSPNPMLEREVRRRARWRRSPRRAQKVARVLAVLAILPCGWAFSRLLGDPASHSEDAWSVVTIIAFLVIGFFS